MTRHIARILTAFLGTVLCFAGFAQAQYIPHSVKVNVPFEFSFRNQTFPAGDYFVLCTPAKIELRNADQHVLATEIPHAVESAGLVDTKLVFGSGEGVHVLRQIWVGGSRYGYELSPSRGATLLAKQHTNKPATATGGTQ
jgi:hypothetical protein